MHRLLGQVIQRLQWVYQVWVQRLYKLLIYLSLDIENGGRTNYSIKVDKRDAQDRIYMHITGKNGNTSVFAGTDILSESGVTSGYQEYTGGFDFAGTITNL